MSLLHALIPLMLMQVGPNPGGIDSSGLPDILSDRPERPQSRSDPATPSDPNAAWLAACLTQLETDPARAHAQAQIKLADGLGAEKVVANHCRGLAATELGLWQDAQAAFTGAREGTPEEEVRVRARFAAMAGNAALAGGDALGALALLEIAQADAAQASSSPLQVIAALDKARALVALDRGEEALAPLETATSLAPQMGEGWLLKATLLRRLGRLGDAQAAIEQAVAVAPMDGAIGLEAGVIAVLSGREDAARQSWQSVIDTAPGSREAATASDYLAQIAPEAEPAPAAQDAP